MIGVPALLSAKIGLLLQHLTGVAARRLDFLACPCSWLSELNLSNPCFLLRHSQE
jgi:hypothetical protein